MLSARGALSMRWTPPIYTHSPDPGVPRAVAGPLTAAREGLVSLYMRCHRRRDSIGMTATAEVELVEIDGRALFALPAVVGEGIHRRAIIE
ncbi:hypothetical protein Pden_3334 [Paracoccus denitrificans PD1222]|uniref:Uncharacterized protein n=1 Tax=Paracoccus denitrificans (strain Pd 1222) TaxID=318586 RepID=A1B7B4_PARDP|nr:hypothetical protein Pden_3334 [Paracoccus denitrificans PD1222]